MNTTENNKLIAEFMGYEFMTNNIFINRLPKDFLDNSENYKCFHNSFDWLMEVVERIEGLGFSTSIYHLPKTLNTVKIISGGADVVGVNGSTKIEAVYKAIAAFIKWYNLTQKEIKNQLIRDSIDVDSWAGKEN